MSNLYKYHRFLDEAGDTTFFGKGKTPIIGFNGVSKSFAIGMVRFNEPLDEIREKIIAFQNKIATHPLYKDIPSVKKRVENGGFYFHAKDDLPELRKDFFDLINTFDCSIQIIVAKKNVTRFVHKHNAKDAEFYADILSHLIKDKFKKYNRLVLNIAKRDSSTKTKNLISALEKAKGRFDKNPRNKDIKMADILFNVVPFTQEPLLAVSDYLCWTVQRVFEKGETRYYDYMISKISIVVDLYDNQNYKKGGNYYTLKKPLTPKNEISPQIT